MVPKIWIGLPPKVPKPPKNLKMSISENRCISPKIYSQRYSNQPEYFKAQDKPKPASSRPKVKMLDLSGCSKWEDFTPKIDTKQDPYNHPDDNKENIEPIHPNRTIDKSTIQGYLSNIGKNNWLKKFPKNPFKKRLATLTSQASNRSPKLSIVNSDNK